MLFWALFLLLGNFELSFGASVGTISANVHVAANDHMVVFARNRDAQFHITFSPYETPTAILHLNYTSVETNTVRNLVISRSASRRGLFDLVFIGERDNSSERVLFHIGLQRDERNQTLSFVPFWHTSIASLSSVGVECALGIHPLGTYVVVLGDRAGYIYDMNDSLLYDWTSWGDSNNQRYPKVISVTEDNNVIVVVYLRLTDTIIPAFYNAKIYSKHDIQPLTIFLDQIAIEIPNIRSPASITLRGFAEEGDLIMAVGLPSVDMVILYLRNKGFQSTYTEHHSAEKGINFGQAVTITTDKTYGVLASGRATPPWSNSRVQVCCVLQPSVIIISFQFFPIPCGNFSSRISPLPLFVYPNNQQHYPYHHSVHPLPFDIVSLFSWTDGFGIVVSQYNTQYALLLPASPPGDAPIRRNASAEISASSIRVLSPDRCRPGTYKSEWGSSPCQLCPPKTMNNGSYGVQCYPCDANNGSSSICFRGASHKIHRERLVDREKAEPFPDSPDSSQFDDVLLNHVFRLGSTSNPRCLVVAPMFWGSIAVGLAMILFTGILLLGRFSKLIRTQVIVKVIFTHLDLIGEGQLWLGGLVTLAIIALVTFTCKFSISFSDMYPIENVTFDARESISCDSSLINAKFSSSLMLLSTRKHAEEKPIFDLLDEQKINLTVEFISTGFECSSVTVQQNFARGQVQEIDCFNCSYEKGDTILIVSTVLPQHLITIQVNLQGPFVVGGLRVCLSGPNTTTADGRYAVQSLDFCHFVYTPDQVLSVNAVTNIEMTKVINRTAVNSVDAESRETFSGIWLPTWTTDKSSLWDSHIYSRAENEYRRSLNWQLSLIVEMEQSKFYMNNIQEPIARSYEIVFKTVLFSMLFLDLFGLLFLMVKVIFVPLWRFIQRNVLCGASVSSTTARQKDQVITVNEDHKLAKIDLRDVIDSSNIKETSTK